MVTVGSATVQVGATQSIETIEGKYNPDYFIDVQNFPENPIMKLSADNQRNYAITEFETTDYKSSEWNVQLQRYLGNAVIIPDSAPPAIPTNPTNPTNPNSNTGSNTMANTNPTRTPPPVGGNTNIEYFLSKGAVAVSNPNQVWTNFTGNGAGWPGGYPANDDNSGSNYTGAAYALPVIFNSDTSIVFNIDATYDAQAEYIKEWVDNTDNVRSSRPRNNSHIYFSKINGADPTIRNVAIKLYDNAAFTGDTTLNAGSWYFDNAVANANTDIVLTSGTNPFEDGDTVIISPTGFYRSDNVNNSTKRPAYWTQIIDYFIYDDIQDDFREYINHPVRNPDNGLITTYGVSNTTIAYTIRNPEWNVTKVALNEVLYMSRVGSIGSATYINDKEYYPPYVEPKPSRNHAIQITGNVGYSAFTGRTSRRYEIS